jgi:hypothetical protein
VRLPARARAPAHRPSESTSNNRVKSGYADRRNAPIDTGADAGARAGGADGRETTEAGVASADIVVQPPPASRPGTPSVLLSPPLGRAQSPMPGPSVALLSPPGA